MKYCYYFFAVVLFSISACTPIIKPHFTQANGPYDSEIIRLKERLEHFPRHHKHILAVEYQFQMAQRHDLRLIDSLEKINNNSEKCPIINAAYRRIQKRQDWIAPLMPIRSRKGYVPNLFLVEDIYTREEASRRDAADYFYNTAMTLLDSALTTQQKLPARTAYHLLDELRTYFYPKWRNSEALIQMAKNTGMTYVLVQNEVAYPFFGNEWEDIKQWMTFHPKPHQSKVYDYEAKYASVTVNVEPEYTSSSTHTETKQVQCGEEIVRDSCGREISRKPIYRTVCETIYTCTTTRSASGSMQITITDLKNSERVLTKSVFGHDHFSESNSSTVMCNCPSSYHSTLESHVVDQLKHAFLMEVYAFMQ